MENAFTYVDTLVLVAEDCPALVATVPKKRAGKATVATIQYAMLAERPYVYTQDEIVFRTYLAQNALVLAGEEREEAKRVFFETPRSCMRASPLVRSYGWGIHFNASGTAALVGRETEEYHALAADTRVKKEKGMKRVRETK